MQGSRTIRSLDRETNVLFGYLERRDDHAIDITPHHPVMQRWWAHMSDIMRLQ